MHVFNIIRSRSYCETKAWKSEHGVRSHSTFFTARRLCAHVLRDFLKKKHTPTIRDSKRSSVTDENRPKMKSSVQIMCAIGEWNLKHFSWSWGSFACDYSTYVIGLRSLCSETKLLWVLETRSGHNWSSVFPTREELPILLSMFYAWSHKDEMSAWNALWCRHSPGASEVISVLIHSNLFI